MKKVLAIAVAMLVLFFGVETALASVQYTVVKGDSMWKIAVKFQVGLSEIIAANPQIKSGNPSLIYPGEVLTIPTTSTAVTSYEQRVIDLTNQKRVANGLPALKANWELSRVARFKSQDMHDLHYFSHTSPTYGDPFTMMRNFGISFRAAGENIAYGQATPEAVVTAWWNSPGHRANMLNASFTQIGVGYVADGHYWTQEFIGQ